MNELQLSTALLLWMHHDVYVTLGTNKTRWLVKCGKTWPPALGIRKNWSPPEPVPPFHGHQTTFASHTKLPLTTGNVLVVQHHQMVHGKILLHSFPLLTNSLTIRPWIFALITTQKEQVFAFMIMRKQFSKQLRLHFPRCQPWTSYRSAFATHVQRTST